ncbi:MAG: protein phosphatase 2C domain-containing protein [Pseudomonadales bacterium]
MTAVRHNIYTNSRMTACELLELPGGSIAVFSCRAPYKSESMPNEDAAAFISANTDTTVIMVADGVGGYPAGAEAASTTITTIIKQLERTRAQEMRESILSAIEAANQELISRGIGSATTLALTEVNGTTVRSYHVGDSVAMMVGQRGKLKLETVSHSPVGYAVESGVISEAEGFHHEERHLVSNIIGTANMHVTLGMPMPMSKFDTILLATDGLFDNLPREEIIEVVRYGNLEQSANELAARASDRMVEETAGGKADDLTFMLFRKT